MRLFDHFLRMLLWLCVGISLLILALAFDVGGKAGNLKNSQQGFTNLIIYAALWLPSVIGVWSWDKTGTQSSLFYICAVIAIALAVRIVIYLLEVFISFI